MQYKIIVFQTVRTGESCLTLTYVKLIKMSFAPTIGMQLFLDHDVHEIKSVLWDCHGAYFEISLDELDYHEDGDACINDSISYWTELGWKIYDYSSSLKKHVMATDPSSRVGNPAELLNRKAQLISESRVTENTQ